MVSGWFEGEDYWRRPGGSVREDAAKAPARRYLAPLAEIPWRSLGLGKQIVKGIKVRLGKSDGEGKRNAGGEF